MTYKKRKKKRKLFYYHGRTTDYFKYKEWRRAVFKRDGGICQFPGCGSKIKVQGHHIRRWVDFPSLRYSPDNGICLCKKCHEHIKDHENSYAVMFMRIVCNNNKKKDNM